MINDLTTNDTMIGEREPELQEFTREECEREYWRVLGYEPDMESDPNEWD